MTFQEWSQNNYPFYLQIKNSYPTVFEYFEFKYGGLVIKYDETRFGQLVQVFVLDHMQTLNAIEAIIEASKNKFNFEDLIPKTVGKTTGEGADTSSYQGTNVSGDYNKVAFNKMHNQEFKKVDIINTIAVIANTPVDPLLKQLSKDFKKLLITYYKLDI